MRKVAITTVVLLLSGCAYTMKLMPRDGGVVYTGHVHSNGMGSGTLDVALDNKTCTGTFATAHTGDSFGFFQAYGHGSAAAGSFQSYGASSTYKALMTCTDGTGLRCDVEGADTGAGICVDSKGRVYDMLYTP